MDDITHPNDKKTRLELYRISLENRDGLGMYDNIESNNDSIVRI